MTKTTVPTTPATFHVEHPEPDARILARQLLGLHIGESATIGATTRVTRADDRWFLTVDSSTIGSVSTAAAAALCALGWAAFPEAQAANAGPAPRGWEAV